jgi:hypothetical protein
VWINDTYKSLSHSHPQPQSRTQYRYMSDALFMTGTFASLAKRGEMPSAGKNICETTGIQYLRCPLRLSINYNHSSRLAKIVASPYALVMIRDCIRYKAPQLSSYNERL